MEEEPRPGRVRSDSDRPDAEPGLTRVLDEAVSLVEAAVEYLVALLRLEGYRIESGARAIVARLVAFAIAAAIGLLGLLFVSFAAAIWIANRLESTAAGFAIVGGLSLAAAAGVAFFAARRVSAKTAARSRQ